MTEKLSQRFSAWTISRKDKFDKKIYSSRKKKLLKELRGNVLEIGAGTGVNFNYYPKNIRLTCVEPNEEIHKYLKQRAKKLNTKIELENCRVEKLPFENNRFDFVVSTLVLCSVDDLPLALKEIKRVLKKGGKYIFIEHVADDDGTLRRKIQNILPHTPWKFLSGNCRPNRESWKFIESAGWRKIKIEHYKQKMPGKFLGAIFSPHISGWVMK